MASQLCTPLLPCSCERQLHIYSATFDYAVSCDLFRSSYCSEMEMGVEQVRIDNYFGNCCLQKLSAAMCKDIFSLDDGVAKVCVA